MPKSLLPPRHPQLASHVTKEHLTEVATWCRVVHAPESWPMHSITMGQKMDEIWIKADEARARTSYPFGVIKEVVQASAIEIYRKKLWKSNQDFSIPKLFTRRCVYSAMGYFVGTNTLAKPGFSSQVWVEKPAPLEIIEAVLLPDDVPYGTKISMMGWAFNADDRKWLAEENEAGETIYTRFKPSLQVEEMIAKMCGGARMTA